MVLLAGLVILSGCFMTTEASSQNVTVKMKCRTDDNQFIPKTRGHSTNPVYEWPQGKVPYRFEGRVTSNDRWLFRSAMKKIEAETCIRFYEDQSPPRHYLKIIVKSPSCSKGGRSVYFDGEVSTQAGSQVVTFLSRRQLGDQPHCRDHVLIKGFILHELMHALGIKHTHKRSDRDKYIKVNKQNIQWWKLGQYSPPCYSCENHGVPYDCSSIMHYGAGTWANGNGPTMTSLVSGCKISPKNGPAVATKNDWDLLRAAFKDQCNGGGCSYTDKFRSCPKWKDQGHCTRGPHVRWMATYCAKSCKCNAASADNASSCRYKDEWSDCQRYKKYCTSGPWMEYMAKVCAKTCNC